MWYEQDYSSLYWSLGDLNASNEIGAALQHKRRSKETTEHETPEHLPCHSPALSQNRALHVGAYQLESLEGVGKLKIAVILGFLNDAGW